MPTPRPAAEVLDGESLTIRANLIDLAAELDRVERAEGSVADDPRMEQIDRAIRLLASATSDRPVSDRTGQLQLVFSLPYEQDWQKEFGH